MTRREIQARLASFLAERFPESRRFATAAEEAAALEKAIAELRLEPGMGSLAWEWNDPFLMAVSVTADGQDEPVRAEITVDADEDRPKLDYIDQGTLVSLAARLVRGAQWLLRSASGGRIRVD